MPVEREQLEADVLIVGAGPAGLATAIHLARLIEAHNQKVATGAAGGPKLAADSIYVLEKAREVGQHSLSGAILDPRALRELFPDFEKRSAPLESPVTDDAVYYLTESRALKFPITPPPLRNHGNYVVSLSRLAKWLSGEAEKSGVNVFVGFAGSEMLYENSAVAGVRTDDKGLDRDAKPKDNYQPGYKLRAKVTVLAEGPRGSLTKQLIEKFRLDEGRNPQVYAVGIKEIWELEAGLFPLGRVIHTLGWPLGSGHYGGGWIYGLANNRVSLGLVAGLDYENPAFDPQDAFQQFKTHPYLRRLLEGGKLIRYGAKTIPEGGYYAIPRTYTDGALLIGDGAGFLNSQRLKGIHLAMKTGMLAAETILEALVARDFSAKTLASFERRVESSWVREELWRVRNFHQAFERGLWRGMFHAGLQFLTGGRGLYARYANRAGHERMRKLSELRAARIEGLKPDGKVTFDRLTDVFYSGTKHEEDQPCHLRISDLNICNTRCVIEYGNPCQHFCPAAVYEMVEDATGKHLKLNPSNCVHCKTCDIMDPYQIITWVPPEGGGGPNYDGM